jgi:uncharacterized protein
MHAPTAARPFHLMAKPSGPACNLACTYCFYISRWDGKVRGMDEATLERFIISYIEANPSPEVTFGWQGGEPTLMGLDFFRRVVALQKQHCPPGKQIQNAIQTNGTLLDDEWCTFLREHHFLVGLSVDGPAKLHDRTRVDRGGKPTAERVRAAAELLVRNKVEFNILCVVGSHNAHAPLQVYRFLRRLGTQFIQFIPIVERRESDKPHDFAAPEADQPGVPLDPVSITPEAWGRFLIGVFDEWVTCDVGRIYIRDFDNWLGMWTGLPSTLCIHAETCGDAMAVEADGSVYSCDHFVYPAYRLGRMGEQSLADMVESTQQRTFGNDKRDTLPQKCLDCRWRKLCHGGCPKHRFPAERGAPPAPHLCQGWMDFFAHAAPAFDAMAGLLAKQQPPALVMSDRAVLRRLGVAR